MCSPMRSVICVTVIFFALYCWALPAPTARFTDKDGVDKTTFLVSEGDLFIDVVEPELAGALFCPIDLVVTQQGVVKSVSFPVTELAPNEGHFRNGDTGNSNSGIITTSLSNNYIMLLGADDSQGLVSDLVPEKSGRVQVFYQGQPISIEADLEYPPAVWVTQDKIATLNPGTYINNDTYKKHCHGGIDIHQNDGDDVYAPVTGFLYEDAFRMSVPTRGYQLNIVSSKEVASSFTVYSLAHLRSDLIYNPVNHVPILRKGQWVFRDKRIAYVGNWYVNYGDHDHNHIHFGIERVEGLVFPRDIIVNPLNFYTGALADPGGNGNNSLSHTNDRFYVWPKADLKQQGDLGNAPPDRNPTFMDANTVDIYAKSVFNITLTDNQGDSVHGNIYSVPARVDYSIYKENEEHSLSKYSNRTLYSVLGPDEYIPGNFDGIVDTEVIRHANQMVFCTNDIIPIQMCNIYKIMLDCNQTEQVNGKDVKIFNENRVYILKLYIQDHAGNQAVHETRFCVYSGTRKELIIEAEPG